jgi:hypothetical protein
LVAVFTPAWLIENVRQRVSCVRADGVPCGERSLVGSGGDGDVVVAILGRCRDPEARRRGGHQRGGVGVVLQVELLLRRSDIQDYGLGFRAVRPQDVLPVARHCDRGEDRNDDDHDHQLDQGEAS